MWRIVLLFFALCGTLLAHSLIFERDIIYHLNKRDFRLENGILSIDFTQSAENLANETLQTRHSRTTLNDNLRFYRHTQGNSEFLPNLMRVNARSGGYFARLDKNIKNILADKFMENCFLLFKNKAQKTLQTKSHAVLLDLDDRIVFEILDISRNEAYFGCFGDGRYVF